MVRTYFPANCVSCAAAIAVTFFSVAAVSADDYADNLRRLASKDDSEAEKAADWFAKYPFDSQKQAEVSRALNALDRDGVRTAARPALAVWGTKENVPLVANLLRDKLDRDVALQLAAKYPDPQLVEPLIAVLASPFDDGKRAEMILAKWSADADAALIQRLNDPDDETHNRIARILAERKLNPKLLAGQSLDDLGSPDVQRRQYAAEWLAEAEEVPSDLHAPLTAAALKLLDDSKTQIRISAEDILKHCAHKDHDGDLLKLLDHKDLLHWQAGLKGLIHTGNVAGAKKLVERMKNATFLNQACGVLTGGGPAAENLALAILREPLEGKGDIHLAVVVVVGNIGDRKSLPALQQFARRNSRGPQARLVATMAENAAKKITARKKSAK